MKISGLKEKMEAPSAQQSWGEKLSYIFSHSYTLTPNHSKIADKYLLYADNEHNKQNVKNVLVNKEEWKTQADRVPICRAMQLDFSNRKRASYRGQRDAHIQPRMDPNTSYGPPNPKRNDDYA